MKKTEKLSSHMDNQKGKDTAEYIKFAGVILFIAGLSFWHASWRGMDLLQYMESFMGVFFIIFALFKIYNLREFAYSFKSYELMQDKSVWWGYTYPFIQILFGSLYLLNYGSRVVDGVVMAWSSFGAYVVVLTLRKRGDIHCLCLGNVIKLPLSTISFVEDFGMAVMALVMLMIR